VLFFDPLYLIFISPALLLMIWAQYRVKSAYGRGMQMPAPLSGGAAARYILDKAGLQDVGIQPTQGYLSDHYDPRERIVNLSAEVYHTQSLTAVGIAAHEVGHAIQHARGYLPLVIRNAAVPAATYGPVLFMILVIVGMILASPKLILLGIAAYGGLLVFELVNLPVEFDASNRAKQVLSELNIVDGEGALVVRDVLNAAGWTYVAATLQTLLTLLYYVLRFTGAGSSNRD
jgi:Zn-dependent membrane protease YugP